MHPLNWKLISHPINWVVVLLMLIIAGTAGHLFLSIFEKEPATADSYANVPAGVSYQTTDVSAMQPQS